MNTTLPLGWVSKPLINLADYFNGAAFNEKHWAKDGLPIIRIEQLKNPHASCDLFDGTLPDKYLLDLPQS